MAYEATYVKLVFDLYASLAFGERVLGYQTFILKP